MFFEADTQQTVVLKPCDLLGDSEFFQRTLVARLLEDVNKVACKEGRGHIVAVTTISDVSDGKIRPDTGSVIYDVGYKAIVCYLVNKEVVEAVVAEVSKTGCFADVGPCRIFIPVGFLAEFQFKPGADISSHSFQGSDGARIRIGSIVRVEIMNKAWMSHAGVYWYIGSMARDQCGLSPAFDEYGNPLKEGSPVGEWDKDYKLFGDSEVGEGMQVDEDRNSLVVQSK